MLTITSCSGSDRIANPSVDAVIVADTVPAASSRTTATGAGVHGHVVSTNDRPSSAAGQLAVVEPGPAASSDTGVHVRRPRCQQQADPGRRTRTAGRHATARTRTRTRPPGPRSPSTTSPDINPNVATNTPTPTGST